MKLKVCGMRDPDNVRELLDQVRPDWMGLIFHPSSSRFVTDEYAAFMKEIAVKKVGVFVNSSLTNILKKIQDFDLSTLQVHGNESVDEVKEIKENTGKEIFKVYAVQDQIQWSILEPYLPYVDYFLFDTFTKAYGGSGRAFNWDLLLDYPFEIPFLLSGGIGLEHVEAIREIQQKVPQMKGVDINSKFEFEAAFKDIGSIKRFKTAIETVS